jgi:hypothetical protein
MGLANTSPLRWGFLPDQAGAQAQARAELAKHTPLRWEFIHYAR